MTSAGDASARHELTCGRSPRGLRNRGRGPTAIAGIYGMNFEEMPELQQDWGYPVVLAVIVAACLLLYRAFRRERMALTRRA